MLHKQNALALEQNAYNAVNEKRHSERERAFSIDTTKQLDVRRPHHHQLSVGNAKYCGCHPKMYPTPNHMQIY